MLRIPFWIGLATVVALAPDRPAAQDRLTSMPGYERYRRIAPQIPGAVRSGALRVVWSADGRTFEYVRDGRRYRYDVRSRRVHEISDGTDWPAPTGAGRGPLGTPERGRQYAFAESPDGRLRARHDDTDRNLYVLDRAANVETRITADGSRDRRIKYGTASWVYGEELEQTTAMWWSPDGRKLAFYRFDESAVPDYFLSLDQTKRHSTIEAEPYPKAGTPNPVVDLLIYDGRSGTTITVDVRDGRPFADAAVGHYVYRVAWSPDGRELLFQRSNRHQNVLELAAADPATGRVRVVLRETWPTGWVETNPTLVFLQDGRRFIWESERSGWKNYYLYDGGGSLVTPLTRHRGVEVGSIVKVDETAGVLFYTARDGDNHLKLQLHRVGLDGRGDVRLTDPASHHTIGSCLPRAAGPEAGRGPIQGCAISPDNAWFVDVYQTHDTPAATRLVNARTGEGAGDIAAADTTRFGALGLRRAELFTFLSADGQTELHGLVQVPSNFDPSRKYPVLLPVYAGPGASSHTARETFVTPSPLAEYGFLIVTLDTRAAPGRGKAVADRLYLRLGQAEVDDLAAGVRALAARPYVDPARIGIFGTSYGGYAAVMALLRYPELFAAASASSPVTAWTNYDTIYTERYMRLPHENRAGYEAGSAITHAGHLKGRLMLFYGTADNNVHPANTLQLVSALQSAGRSFDVQVGPDRGHGGINPERMMEFFIEALRPADMAGGWPQLLEAR